MGDDREGRLCFDLTERMVFGDYQYFAKEFRSGYFSRSLAGRLKSLLRFSGYIVWV